MQDQTVIPTPWPFKYVNGQQTQQSRALQSDKGQHRPSGANTPINLSDIEEALW